MGKSAQFPLHVWLPDAMEGPTPVSALIHAATMVTAGVYLVARCTPLFVLAVEVQLIMAGIGCFTALLAGLIALTQNDLKRVLAYSTVSQLGYMFLALGCAGIDSSAANLAITAAMFHLFTHAFFKAVLFLGAGSVMHAMGDVIDMREFGGLRRLLPVTHWTFLCGAAALAGIPLLSGFWSKDEILAAVAAGFHSEVYSNYARILFGAAAVTAILTGFYTFRAYYLTFWGPLRIPPQAGHHAHESPASMTQPLVVLAIASLLVGALVGPTGWYAKYLAMTPGLEGHAHHELNWGVMAASTAVALLGVALATWMYQNATRPEKAVNLFGPLASLSEHRFFLDEIYSALLVRPLEWLAQLCILVDRIVIDVLLDVLANIPGAIGYLIRPWQNGLVSRYVFGMSVGLVLLLWLMLIRM
jgi:NADH-quinone oxidoreductase subunit L